MEERQSRLMVALAIVLVALAALLVFWSDEEPRDEDATVDVLQVEETEIQSLTIEGEGGIVVLQRENEVWWLTTPIRYRANDRSVHEILDAIGEIRYGVPVEGSPADFGLEPPDVKLRVELASGVTHELWVGREAPIDRKTYVRRPGEPIAAVDGRPRDALLLDVSGFRDPRLLSFAPEDVREVGIEGPDGRLVVDQVDGRWWLDGFTRANPDKVDHLVMGLLDLRFDTFTDGAAQRVDEPEYRVWVQTDSGRTGFDVARVTPLGQLVVLEDGTAGMVVPETLALLGQGPTEVGDPRAFPTSDEDERIRVEWSDGTTLALNRTGSTWSASAGEADPIVAALRDARIHYRMRPVAPVEETWATVRLCCPDRAVRLGPVEEEYRVAVDEAGGAPYLIPLEDLRALRNE